MASTAVSTVAVATNDMSLPVAVRSQGNPVS